MMAPVVCVRSARVDDAPGIARVLVDGWTTTYADILPAEFLATFRYETHEAGTRQHLEHLPDSSAAFVAIENKRQVSGVALVRAPQSGPPGFTSELDALYVLPTRQRRGIGRQLLREVVRWSLERGHGSLFLWVLRDNPYRRFYDSLGAELLNSEQVQTFSGSSVIAVSYGWRDLREFDLRLQRQPGGTKGDDVA
jgi:GNAT superfamily N-acetyltransferase